MSNGLTREFLHERDLRIFAMRKGGMSINEIAKRVGISTRAVSASLSRQLARLNQEAVIAYPEVMRLELERLDALQAAIWPQTQPRIEEIDGVKVMREPDPKAIDTVLRIMQQRSRLLGMEQANINLVVEQPTEPVRAALDGAVNREAIDVDSFDPKEEAKALLSIMMASGALPDDDPVLRQIAGIVDVNEIEDGDDGPRQLGRGDGPAGETVHGEAEHGD